MAELHEARGDGGMLVAVEVFFGKDHPVDSSEAAFKTAGRVAFKNGFLGARPVLLEPIVDLEVTIPSKHTGAIGADHPFRFDRNNGCNPVVLQVGRGGRVVHLHVALVEP